MIAILMCLGGTENERRVELPGLLSLSIGLACSHAHAILLVKKTTFGFVCLAGSLEGGCKNNTGRNLN